MSKAPVIHIGGWPGSGKATIGLALADLCGGRLLHNHIFLDGARAVFERGTAACAELREQIREVILTAALGLPDDVPIILTDALSDAEEDFALFQPTIDFARKRGAVLFPVVLDVEVSENVRRLTNAGRSGAKLTDVQVLMDLRERLELLMPENAVWLDVTDLKASAAAHKIAKQTGLI